MFEGAVIEWAKALRLPWKVAVGRHTETRDWRAHHHESSCHRIFFWIFDEAVPLDYIRHWILKCGCDVYPSQDVVALCVLSQTVRDTW